MQDQDPKPLVSTAMADYILEKSISDRAQIEFQTEASSTRPQKYSYCPLQEHFERFKEPLIVSAYSRTSLANMKFNQRRPHEQRAPTHLPATHHAERKAGSHHVDQERMLRPRRCTGAWSGSRWTRILGARVQIGRGLANRKGPMLDDNGIRSMLAFASRNVASRCRPTRAPDDQRRREIQ